jgi:pimeloyl-ACP methyl ester carboxylesterase
MSEVLLRASRCAALAALTVACSTSASAPGPTPERASVTPPAPSTAPVDAAEPPPADAGRDAETCAPRDTDEPPRAASFPKKLAGQDAWIHDPSLPAGYFHTFDAMDVGGGAAERHKVHVFLPRSYASGGCARYPVVYFHDGDTTFFPGGGANKTWDVAGVLAKAYAAGVPELIVVAVRPNERDREYTHTAWLAGRACCGVRDYTAWLADGLKPFVDGAYRTMPEARSTVIVGSSHGGLAAYWAASTRPDAFGGAIAMSPSFWAGLDRGGPGGPLASSPLMASTGASLRAGRPRLYIDWGLVRTGGDHNAIIEAAATARGVEMRDLLASTYGYTVGKDLFWVEDPAGEHEEISWGRRLARALELVLTP